MVAALAFCFVIRHSSFVIAAPEGAAFLTIDTDARAIGMGGAYTALAQGAGAVYWNPAGLAGADRREASASHADWFAGLTHQHAAYAQPRVFGGTLGLGVTSLRSDAIEARDADRQAAGSFTAGDTALTVSYGKTQGLNRLGMSVKLIEQRLGGHQARGAAVDVGLNRPLPFRGLSLGVAAQNIGPKLAFEGGRPYDLPMMLKSGVAYEPSPAFSFSMDVKHQVNPGDTELAWGAEFQPMQALALRAGYSLPVVSGFGSGFGGEGNSLGGIRGIQGGLGLSLSGYRLDYAILPFGELGNTQRVSFSAKF